MNISLTPSSSAEKLIAKLNNPKVAMIALKSGLKRGSDIFQSEAKQNAPVDTGNLRRNIKTEVKQEEARIYSDLKPDYAIHQEYGTGIYGKRGSYITPKRAKFLRFKTKGGKIVFAKRVKGVKGRKFFYLAGETLKRRMNEVNNIIEKELKTQLGI